MSATEIMEEIRRSPPLAQCEVVEWVRSEFGDTDDELTPDQAAEVDRWLAEFEQNPQGGIPLEQIQAEMTQPFGWRCNCPSFFNRGPKLSSPTPSVGTSSKDRVWERSLCWKFMQRWEKPVPKPKFFSMCAVVPARFVCPVFALTPFILRSK